eukprot:12786073-Ditylum_brightwellii.AAC.1
MSEKCGTTNRGLHGGRKGHDAQTLSLIEELKYDISYSLQRILINVDNNTALCYDRILPNISSLIVCKKGICHDIIFVHANTLEEAKYRLKTALGVSDDCYTHCELYPMYGSGQGAAHSPHIWLVISSTICDIYDENAKGAEFVSPDQAI